MSQNLITKFGINRQIFIAIIVSAFVVLYFFYYTLFGQKGVVKYFELRSELKQKELIKSELQNKMQNKQHMIDSMNLKSLDLDLLDEEARKNLGYAAKDEIVIYDDQDKTVPKHNPK